MLKKAKSKYPKNPDNPPIVSPIDEAPTDPLEQPPKAEEPPFPLPRKFFSDDQMKEKNELATILGGEPEDWDVVNGFWEVKNKEDE